MSDANAEQHEFWNEQAGPIWVRWQERLDEGIRPHGERAMQALAPRPGERILDLGCGCGESSLRLAERVAPGGEVLGVDLSATMLERARARAAEDGIANVRFEQADVQEGALPESRFDAAFSRFGVMFFADPVAAFRNVARALVPGGRLAFVCWRAPQDNPWVTVPMSAIAPLVPLPAPPPQDSPGMFGFADAARVRSVLEGAGWQNVSVEPMDLGMAAGGAGAQAADAAAMFVEVGPVAAALREAEADDALRSQVKDAVARAYAPHQGSAGVELASGAWLVTARHPAA